MSQLHYMEDMNNNLLSFFYNVRESLHQEQELEYGLIQQDWPWEVRTKHPGESKTYIDVYIGHCHTLKSLINYHDYLLYWSINRSKQPEDLWLLYDKTSPSRAWLQLNAFYLLKIIFLGYPQMETIL